MTAAERVSQLQEKLYRKAKQERSLNFTYCMTRQPQEQRRSRLYGHQAFELLVNKYGLIDPTKYNVRNSM
jgi:hypothetical protein